MRRAGFAGGFWPTPFQERLLQAALSPAAEAARAWSALRPELDLDDVWDPQVHRLLPLVGSNLGEAGLDDPDLPRLQGLGRRTWYENQIRVRDLAPAVAALEAAAIPTVMLKGMTLAFHYYPSPALRPMRDGDVLVPVQLREEALRVLAAEGWSGDVRSVNRFHHGLALDTPDGRSLDLHWYLGLPFLLDGSDEGDPAIDFWAAARPFTLGDVRTRMLHPGDQLLHVCVHGAWSRSRATVRWIADAVTVMRKVGDPVDWDRLVRQVERRRLSLLVAEPLRYLAEVFGAPVPPEVLVAVARMPSTRRERTCRRRSTLDWGGEGLSARARLAVIHWSRTSARWSRLQAARELPFYLQDVWSLDSPWRVPAVAARKASKRLMGNVRAPAA